MSIQQGQTGLYLVFMQGILGIEDLAVDVKTWYYGIFVS
jgi:hypothetical protein